MENKYYIPDISEFHVGFECEDLESNKVLIDSGLLSLITSNECDWNTIVSNAGHSMKLPKEGFRVKYLDKEDVESLGFEEYEKNWFRKRIHKEYPGYYYIIPTTFYGENSWLIETDMLILTSTGFFETFGNRKELFNGVIKNKSEFKVLLKQLKIK